MRALSIRMALPRGVTHVHVARLFARGLSVDWIALKYDCGRSVVENAIRNTWRRRRGTR